jgi:hypothetical protein
LQSQVAVLSVQFSSIYGVDFSGARLAGRTTWVARLQPGQSASTLTELARLEDVCGSAEREAALPCLVQLIRSSAEALWLALGRDPNIGEIAWFTSPG